MPAASSKPPKIGNNPGVEAGLQGFVVPVFRGVGKGLWLLARRPRALACFALASTATFLMSTTLLLVATLTLLAALLAACARWPGAFSQVKAKARQITLAFVWNKRMLACKLDVRDQLPQMREVRIVPWGERIRIHLPPGLAPEDVRKRTPQLAWTFDRKPACRVKVEGDRVWLEFSDGRQLRESISAPEIPDVLNLEALRLGRREGGSQWTLRVLDPERGYRHLFVAGATGAGKSGIFWQAIREMAPGIRDGLLELYVADPKFGVEFDKVQPLCKRYAESDTDIAAMLSAARKYVAARAEEMKAEGVRQHVPRVGSPALALFIDEFPSLLRDCEDPKLAKQMEQDARVLLRLGRVFGVFLWVATQDPRVESFPLRSFFVDEIGLRVRQANHVDMIYGKGAREAGATLDLIPKDMPGTGFEITEDGCEMVRGFHVTEELIVAAVDEYGPPEIPVAELDRVALEQEFAEDGERPASTP
jgi:S-DNA-T family DNA segregation ATPase FtsK/SpoIIIE